MFFFLQKFNKNGFLCKTIDAQNLNSTSLSQKILKKINIESSLRELGLNHDGQSELRVYIFIIFSFESNSSQALT